jgi:SAM-dependent methyltransferase
MTRIEGDSHHPVTFSFTSEREGRSSDGDPDINMLHLITKHVGNEGIYLDVAAGDGRYLKKVHESNPGLHIIAGDLNPKALQALMLRLPEDQANQVSPVVFDAFEHFPLQDESASAVVCTAMLHLRPSSDIRKFAEEAHRVLNPSGILAIDFSTNIRRVDPWGDIRHGPTEADYILAEGISVVKSTLNGLFEISELGVSNVRTLLAVQDRMAGGRFRKTSVDVTLKKVNVIAKKAA